MIYVRNHDRFTGDDPLDPEAAQPKRDFHRQEIHH
jgi:hypothetical protein